MQQSNLRFAELFRGRTDFFGTFQSKGKKDGKMEGISQTVSRTVSQALYDKHLEGAKSLGICPINAQDECHFAAIDVDDYQIDFIKLLEKIEVLELPIVACETKSGGIHLYCFFAEAIEAEYAQSLMRKYAAKLGITYTTDKNGNPKITEIFPKQIKSTDKGSWINLPYFGDSRAALRLSPKCDLNRLSLEEFLDTAKRVSLAKANVVQSLAKKKQSDADEEDDWYQAPPCIPSLLNSSGDKITDERNVMLYNFAVYLKLRYPDDWQEKVLEYNEKYVDPPLPESEIQGTIFLSHEKKDYNFMCSSVPICNFCDRKYCKTKKYGVAGDEDHIEFGDIIVRYTEPKQFLWDINSIQIAFDSMEINNYLKFAVKLLEEANIVLPQGVKMKDIAEIFRDRLNNAKHEQVSIEATPKGQLLDHLYNFIHANMAETTAEDSRESRNHAIANSMVADDGICYCFRLETFNNYLDEKRFKDYTKTKAKDKLIELVDFQGKRSRHNGITLRYWQVNKGLLEKHMKYKEEKENDEETNEDRMDFGSSEPKDKPQA